MMEHEIYRWTGMDGKPWCAMVMELSVKVKLFMYQWIYIPTVPLVMSFGIRSQIQAAKMSFLSRVLASLNTIM